MTVSQAKPSKLFKIPVVIEGRNVLAMMDSGSKDSYVKMNLVNELHIQVDCKDIKQITGFGGVQVQTRGTAYINVSIGDIPMHYNFHVLDKLNDTCDMIIGSDFLREQGITLNIKERIVQIDKKNGGNYCFHINGDNVIDAINVYNVCIVSKADYKIDGKTSMIIDIDTPFEKQTQGELYFEGKDKDNMSFMCGLIDNDTKMIAVENKTKSKRFIRKGDIVGHVSTCIEGEEEYEDEEKWTLEKIKEAVKLEELTENEKIQVHNMLWATSQALSLNDNDIGKAKISPHRIQLNNYTPIWMKPRHFPKPIEDEMEAQCRDLLANDIIEYSNSNWSAPCVPVRKTDGSLRLCMDYRRLNMVTETEKFPMPNLTNCIYKANEMKFFTKIDLVKGYYQVTVDDESKPLTAFSTSNNHFQFKRLPFGLKNSGIAFQKMMQQILAPLKTSNIQVYIDDVLVMSSNFEEHLQDVQKVLVTLQNHGIKVKVKKCEFFKSQVSFLGHVLSSDGIRKSSEYTNKVKDYSKPSTVKELRKFLGLINFQRKFIEKCSEIAKPLTELTKKADKTKIEWTDEQEESFTRIKEEIAKDIVLSYPDYSQDAQKLELYVDASSKGAGACLMQWSGNEYKVIGYNSMCFSQTQKNYSTTERELSAIRWGVKVFKPFIFGISFVIFTDHKPLIHMFNMAANNARIHRTLEELSQYDFEIKYLPGAKNQAADFLSRIEEHKLVEGNCHEDGLPNELRILKKVDGGGNSLFEALLETLRDLNQDDNTMTLPEDHLKLREEVISELIKNSKKYKLIDNKHERNRLKLMYQNNQQPCPEALLAASKLYEIEIRVYHDIKIPVIYNYNGLKKNIVCLQCIGFCHYNPLYARKPEMLVSNVRYVNLINDDTIGDKDCDEPLDVDIVCHSNEIHNDSGCGNHDVGNIHLVSEYEGHKLCSIIDTGSQISIINSEVWERIKTGQEVLIDEELTLRSFDGKTHKSSNIVNIKIKIGDFVTPVPFPFCIVDKTDLSSCVLLGINFLAYFDIILNFRRNLLIIDDQFEVYMKSSQISSQLINIEVDNEEHDSHNIREVEFMISSDELKTLQSSSKVLREIKQKVMKGIPPKQWENPSLHQFKRYAKDIKFDNGLLMINRGKNTDAIIITYPFLVEIVAKVHNKVAHIGRHKLIDLIIKQFWHPAIDNVAREICKCCSYCQYNKINVQQEKPPVMKINSEKPFNLVSMDLVALPTTSNGNVAALVVIDHHSKWMIAIPVKNKSSSTISRALRYQVLPNMLKLPSNILSDNGTEFRGKETEDVLKEFNIKHLYSSPYTPTGNGAVERVNKTLIGILKSLKDDIGKWDVVLNKALIIYNNTYHSQIKCTPAEFLMERVHEPSTQMLVDEHTADNWREGHPNFRPFSTGQKVIKEVSYVGNKTSTKMKPKFDGPYVVKKVQDNGLSYEIAREDNSMHVVKCNHRKLRALRELPWSIKRFLPNIDNNELELDENMIEMPVAILESSSGNFSFEGFSSESESSSDTSTRLDSETADSTEDESDSSTDVYNETTSSSEDSSDISTGLDGESANSYGNSETDEMKGKSMKYVNKNDEYVYKSYLHSTPLSSIDKDFLEFLKNTSFNDALPILEQTLTSQIELLTLSEEKLKELTSILSVTSDELNKAMMMKSNEDLLFYDCNEVPPHQNLTAKSHSGDDEINVSRKSNEMIDDTENNKRNEFNGFNVDNLNVTAQNTIEQLKLILSTCRSTIKVGRERQERVNRELWQYRTNRSINSTYFKSFDETACVLNEVDDTISELNPIHSSTPRRVLRSQGKVQEFPHTQTRTLEYKLRKHINMK